MFLRQSTSAVISFGPFVSPTDGVTLQTGLASALDHASTGIMLSKNGGAMAVRHAAVTASSYDAYGDYLVTLDATDTNTPGRLRVQFAAAGSCLPVWADFDVIEEAVYDALLATGAAGYGAAADVTAIKAKTDNLPGDPADASDIAASFGTVNSTLATIAGYLDTEVTAIKAKTDLIPASPAASGDIPSAASIADAVWDETISGHSTAGSAGAALQAGSSLGAGAISWSYTLTRSDNGQPIADAEVWVTTDSAGTNIIASGRTNQSGVITFMLDAGTVYVWRAKTGFTFTNPDTEVVS